jgi:DNA-binding MarR family transcriptional regulator
MIPTSAGSKPAERAPADLDAARLLELIHEISKCHRLVHNTLDKHVRRWELSGTEFLVLWLCERAHLKGMAQTELASAVGVSAAKMSGLVEHLRQRGYLISQRSDTDRRLQMWQPTPGGCEILQAIGAGLAESSAAWDGTISEQDQQSLVDLLRRLTCTANRPTGLALFKEETPDRKLRTEARNEDTHRRAM